MEPITLPKETPNCPFTQEPVVDAVIGVCGDFFEKSHFQEYIERGGRNCPLCRKKITWYAEIPSYNEKLDQKVSVPRVKLEGEHRIEHHQETSTLEEGIVLNLFLIEKVVEKERFIKWCREKNGVAIQRIEAQLNYDSVAANSQIDALKMHRALAQKLYDSFDYDECRSIQEFVNKFLAEGLNFYLYNLLLKEAFVHQFYRSAQKVMGGEIKRQKVDVEKAIDGAEWGKKMRALIGLVMTLSLMIGIGRKIYRLQRVLFLKIKCSILG